MDDFMDRILQVRFSLAECQTCLERYHGMKMHNAQCDRCHREVRGLQMRTVICSLVDVVVARTSSIRCRKSRRPRCCSCRVT
jgi:hypothetical protein